MLPIVSRSARLPCARVAALAFVAVAFGCSSPTDAGTARELTIEGGVATVTTASLLPAGVAIVGPEFRFVTSPRFFVFDHSLYSICAACEAADLQRIPKPAFTHDTARHFGLPNGVVSAVISRGLAGLTVQNDFNFDPIRPAAGVTGSITAQFLDPVSSDNLGMATIDGATQNLLPGSSASTLVPVGGGVTASLRAVFTYASPLGDSVMMSANQKIGLTVSMGDFWAVSAKLRFTNRSIAATTDMDLTDLEDIRPDRLDSAHVRVTMENTLVLSAITEITLAVPGTSIKRTIAHPGSATSNELVVRLSGSEIRRLAGQRVTLGITGNASADSATVTPSQPVTVASSRIRLFATQ